MTGRVTIDDVTMSIVAHDRGTRCLGTAALAIALAGGGTALADPVSFHTPLPFERRIATINAQGILVRAPDGPAPERANETIAMAQLMAMFHINDRIAVSAAMPYIDRQSSVDTPGGGQVDREAGGIGDIMVGVAARPYRVMFEPGAFFGLGVFASVKAPTGSDNASDDYGRLPQRLQVGTGAWDVAGGATASFCRSPIEADLSVGYVKRTAANDFDAGDEIHAEVSVRRCVAPWRGCRINTPRRLYVVGETRVSHYAPDTGRLAPAETGGPTWYVTPGLQGVLGAHALEFVVQAPITQPSDQHVAAILILGYRMIID